jgi:hypothetical protein
VTAVAVLMSLAERGIRLIPRYSKLITCPASKLTDDDRRAVRECRAELLQLLETAAAVQATFPGARLVGIQPAEPWTGFFADSVWERTVSLKKALHAAFRF